MTGSIEIENSGFEYYRIEFNTPLKSNKYRIYGTIVNKKYEKCSDTIVKFKYSGIYGFSVIIKRYSHVEFVYIISVFLFIYPYLFHFVDLMKSSWILLILCGH